MSIATISIISDDLTEEREEFTVALESVILTHMVNGSALEMSDQQRLILQPARANITILDDDGESVIIQRL